MRFAVLAVLLCALVAFYSNPSIAGPFMMQSTCVADINLVKERYELQKQQVASETAVGAGATGLVVGALLGFIIGKRRSSHG